MVNTRRLAGHGGDPPRGRGRLRPEKRRAGVGVEEVEASRIDGKPQRAADASGCAWIDARVQEDAVVVGELGAFVLVVLERARRNARRGDVEVHVGVRAELLEDDDVDLEGGEPGRGERCVLERLRPDTDDDAPRRQAWFLTATRFITVITWPVLVLIAVGADIAVPFLFGQRWIPAAVPLQLLSLGALVGISRWLFAPLCASCGRADIVLGWSAVSVGLQVVAFLITVHWGINAVAASLGVVGLALAVPQTLHVCRAVSVSASRFAKAHLAAAAGCVVLALIWRAVAEALERAGASTLVTLVVATVASLGVIEPATTAAARIESN